VPQDWESPACALTQHNSQWAKMSRHRMKICTDEEAAHIRSLLKQLEWIAGAADRICPCCKSEQARDHKPGCAFHAALLITEQWVGDGPQPRAGDLGKGKWLG
jgi:hypothetical protein